MLLLLEGRVGGAPNCATSLWTSSLNSRDVTELGSHGLRILTGYWTEGLCLLVVLCLDFFIYWSASTVSFFIAQYCYQGQTEVSRGWFAATC